MARKKERPGRLTALLVTWLKPAERREVDAACEAAEMGKSEWLRTLVRAELSRLAVRAELSR